ncbi:MAG: hypothetical protein R3F19_34185 [Verrucomicrobiales bacterium]
MRSLLQLLSYILILTELGFAQAVPSMLHYQGSFDANGVPYSGPATMRFALVSPDGGTTYWSNDGTSVGGSEPTTGVSVILENGACAVALGDVGLANMRALTPSVAASAPDLHLRVWFDDGVNGSQRQEPDAALASVPYALVAAGLAPGAPLELAGTNALRLVGYAPSLTIQDSNSNNARSSIQGAFGDVNLFTESYLSGANPTAFLHVDSSTGSVGIGSPEPTSKLEVAGTDAIGIIGFAPFLTFADSNAGFARARIQGAYGDVNLFTESYLSGANAFAFLHVDSSSGNVGIGSPEPTSKLEVVGQDTLAAIGFQPFITLKDSNAGYARGRIQSVAGEILLETEGFITGTAPDSYAKLENDGNFSVKTLTIRGGSDLAEPFAMSHEGIEPGAVVVIDADVPGKLRLSMEAYDKKVAGIVSGAGGIHPGISMIQEDMLEPGDNVALSGRVYVDANTSAGAIEPGDLLTTSDVPGQAMKAADHERAQGAILGKAMTPLDHGKGRVLVLVTLQ